jgi:hypothetical protein
VRCWTSACSARSWSICPGRRPQKRAAKCPARPYKQKRHREYISYGKH